MQVTWVDKARRDLENIARFYAEINPRAASNIINAIVTKSQLLVHFPYIGVQGASSDLRILYLTKYPYYLVYKVTSRHAVQILSVMRTSQSSSYR